MGDAQTLSILLTFSNGDTQSVESDLTEVLAGFNGSTEPFALTGNLRTPVEGGFAGSIDGWQQADGGNADIFMATLAAAVLTACNNDENNVIDTGSSQATFTAAIDGQVNTRAYDRTWEAGDAIGISGISGGITYTNVQYVTDSEGTNGNFRVETSGNEIYYQDDNPVTFTAYYPWANLASGVTTITADTRAQASQSDFDFLWSRQTGSKASPNVQFVAQRLQVQRHVQRDGRNGNRYG